MLISGGRRLLIAAATALALTGCSRSVTSDVAERDATDIVVALSAYGIAASKKTDDGKRWSVSVQSDDWADAAQVISASGLPRQDNIGMAELMKKDSLVSSPGAERAKMMYALGNELSRSLLDIEGVVTARVHLVVPDRNPFRLAEQASSASVLIKHSTLLKPAELEPSIKNFISRSAEGLKPEAVSVTFVPARAPWSAGAKAPNRNTVMASWYIPVVSAMAALVALLAWWFWRSKKALPTRTARDGVAKRAN